jgi:hypothetical protein
MYSRRKRQYRSEREKPKQAKEIDAGGKHLCKRTTFIGANNDYRGGQTFICNTSTPMVQLNQMTQLFTSGLFLDVCGQPRFVLLDPSFNAAMR